MNFPNIFGLQDELAARIARQNRPELEQRGEAARTVRKPPENIDADLVQRGFALLDRFSADGNAGARQMFEKAIAIDPQIKPRLHWIIF